MEIVIQKFGGTSVASSASRALVLKKVSQAVKAGSRPVVVVSAMGRRGDPYATDTLIDLVKSIHENIAARELDQLMCCGEMIAAVILTATLQQAGLEAVMLTGGQAGIITDNNYNNARCIKCDTGALNKLLAAGKLPVVCGFQGVTPEGELTTLGRGGSDTTAAILGAALEAKQIEIFTDVDGIMTADPKIVKNAKRLNCIGYAEVCQLAEQGAKVIHPRAVEIAKQKNIPILIKSTFTDEPGTVIAAGDTAAKLFAAGAVWDKVASGVTYLSDVVQFKINLNTATPDGGAQQIFQILAASGISVDLINILPQKVMFTVNKENARQAVTKLETAGYNLETAADCAKVSVVGGGMRGTPGVMANFIAALAAHNISILQTVDSHTSISALISQRDVKTAVMALHENFGLAD
ncbi:MAG: aspartate kinase [Sporomusaceae bacterium]|jgi:aspartate kinase|nr:aspartate kinase [Sporomusaceae bacterium]